MRKKSFWLMLIFVAVGIAFALISKRQNPNRKDISRTEQALIPVAVEEVKSADLESILSFIGDIKGEDQVTVYSEATGRLSRYLVEEGTWVEKDQVIALVDRAVTGMEYEEAKVKAPLAGVVGRLYLDRGSTIGLETPVALIARIDRVKVEFSVPEKDIEKVHKGQAVRVRISAHPSRIFRGEVTRISPVVDPLTRTVYAEVKLANPDGALRPGMFAEIEVVTANAKGVIVLSKETIVREFGTGNPFVFVVEGDTAVKRQIETGISQGELVEVKSGLRLGEKVVIAGHHYLKGGEKVEVVEQ